MIQRRLAVLVTLLVLLAAGIASAAPVVISYRDPVAAGLAERFERTWQRQGPALVDDLVPAGVVLDTVACYLVSTEEFRSALRGGVADWGIGAAFDGGRVIAIDHERVLTTGPGPESVFVHEMTHALLEQSVGAARLPHWFHEGIAMRASGEWRFVDSLAVILSGRLPSLDRLDHAFPRARGRSQTAYRTSLAAVTYLESEHGPAAVPRVLGATRNLGDFAAGFRDATGETPEQFARRFAGAMRVRYGWVLMLFRWPTLFVIMALVFLVGAVRKIVINRRALRMEDEGEE
ncbi:hypothetical protein GF314_08280 [bacterium]|nr:hypothetical protein [bacterium]